MKILFYLICIVLLLSSCAKDCADSPRCALDPQVGNCKGAFPRYYHDPSDKKCKVFYWGGCDGIVPFETLEECKEKCTCGDN